MLCEVRSPMQLGLPGGMAAGEDYFTLEVKFPGGRTELQKFTATIGLSQMGPKI